MTGTTGPLIGFYDTYTRDKSSAEVFSAVVGKKIAHIRLIQPDERIYINPYLECSGYLEFEFEDNTRIWMLDAGQTCCEKRYITCGDKLSDFVGSYLVTAEVRDAPDVKNEEGDVHEVKFLLVTTSLGVFTCETHNSHNGYYSGFELVIIEASPSQ